MNPMKKKREQTLTNLADVAFQQAAQKVIERAEESGTPVIVWEHEAVRLLEPRKTRMTRKRDKDK
jgi:hypothetical protein